MSSNYPLLGDTLETLDLHGLRSPEAVAEEVRAAASKRAPGEWIRGHAWDQSLWPGKEFATHAVLTAAAPDHPVYLTRVDGHAAWVNRRAMDIAGITRATPDPPGGRLLRDPCGAPRGVLIDCAEGLVVAKIPEPGADVVKRRLERAAKECARLGITTVHDAGISRTDLEAYRSLIAAKRLPVRVYAMIGGAEKGYARGQHARLAAARACEDEERAVAECDGFQLGWIEGFQKWHKLLQAAQKVPSALSSSGTF